MIVYPAFRIYLGSFSGGASTSKVTEWETATTDPIDIYDDGTGVLSYFFGLYGSVEQADTGLSTLSTAGVTNAKVMFMNSESISSQNWDERLDHGTHSGQINPIVV